MNIFARSIRSTPNSSHTEIQNRRSLLASLDASLSVRIDPRSSHWDLQVLSYKKEEDIATVNKQAGTQAVNKHAKRNVKANQ